MSHQVIARKFRPAIFEDVVGQDAIVRTLKNALSQNKLAHAYLFCGLRGTGKTTLARLLAKAMNCQDLTDSLNPCGICSSCLEFQSTQSIDFIEIDGASHRGIDDIKSIIDTLAYSSAQRYKVILIDEVHMLTKEAFNALLKTLEEPPEHVKFIFATTEAHKLPATILSRCQRFDLARISPNNLVHKLNKIAQALRVDIDPLVLDLVAERAEGSLRDAESLFERITSSQEGKITLENAYDLLGFFQIDLLEELDQVIFQKDIRQLFSLSEKLFRSGKDLKIFFEQYRSHLRQIICSKLGLTNFIKSYPLKQTSVDSYQQSEALYFLDVVTEQLKQTSFDKKIDCETLLLHLVQSKNRVSLQDIVERLEALDSEPEAEPTQLPQAVASSQETIEPANQKPVTNEDKESLSLKPVQFYDTIMQFAATELEGSLKK